MLKFLRSHHTTSVLVYGGAVILLLGAVWVAYQYVDPLPPSKVTIAAGSPSGAYSRYARRYAEIFAEQGVELEIVETNGSMDNLARMADPEGGVDAAFMQGGIALPADHPDLRSLGSLYYEPLWVFHDRQLELLTLADLKGKRVAIGADGSGTRHVISRLLAENNITAENTTLLDIGAAAAVPKLLDGEIDVMFIIAGLKSRVIETMSREGSVGLFSFNRAEAYARSHHYLRRLVLPRGAISLADDLPDRDVNLLAPTANLVVREDMHAAIKFLFLLAADQVHSEGDILSQPDFFPNETALLFPLSDEAESFYKNGPPFLMRYLPYSLAINLERLKILLIPLLTLLYPLFKVTPPAYRWQIRRRIFKWYKDLKHLDQDAYDVTTRDEAEALLAQLEELDRSVLETSVPLSYTDSIYSLRIHIRLIQTRLEKMEFPEEAIEPETV